MAMSPEELRELAEEIARDKSQSATARVRAMELIGRSLSGAAPNGAVPKQRGESGASADPLDDMDDELAPRRAKKGA